MTILDKNGVKFFRTELTKDTDRQIAMFETNPPSELGHRELGRIRLYEEKTKITRHFFVCETDKGLYASNHPHHGLVGKLEGLPASSCLVWKEIEGIRHSINATISTELEWENSSPPKTRLTTEGKFQKKEDIYEKADFT